MEHFRISGEQQALQGGVTNVGNNSTWMHRHLSGSVYLWACGEKADDEDDDPKLCDRLIGWLILFMQGFAYTMLIVLARATSSSDMGSSTDDSGESDYLLPPVTGAMYLLVASTSHDLRAGFSLLVDGSCAGHRSFGIGLLVVYGIMISAAMTVLVSTSDNSASVVLNAVTVLFVADLDEKTLNFLLTVPQRWRLFWAIESAGISFELALIAIYYIGDASPLMEGNNGILKTFPTWFLWGVNPAAVTLCSVVLSSSMHAVCELCSEACQTVDEPTVGAMVASSFQVVTASMKRVNERFRREPWFHVALAIWLAHALSSWFFTVNRDNGFPIAFVFNLSAPESPQASLVMSDNIMALIYSNVVLVAGLAAKALNALLAEYKRVMVVPVTDESSEEGGVASEGGDGCTYSGVSSLLLGSGIGYWITSLRYVLGCSWHGGGCGWNNAPIVVTVGAYVVIPCFLVGCVFMVADINLFGTRFGNCVAPAVSILRDRRTVLFWIMAAVLRDFIDVWIGCCDALRSPLDYYL